MSEKSATEAAAGWLQRLHLGDRADARLEELPWEPAARAIGRRDRARPGARGAGRAVQRAGSARGRVARRAAEADRRDGGRRRVLEPPARSGRGCVRGRRDHRPRKDRDGGRGRGIEGRIAPPVAGGDRERRSWVPILPGGTVTSKQGGRLRVLVDATADVGEILATARQAGQVTSFSFEPPSLTDLFLDAISEGQAV